MAQEAERGEEEDDILDEADLLPDESGKRRISLPPPIPEAARSPRGSRPPPVPPPREQAMEPGSLPPPTQTLPPLPGARPPGRLDSGVRRVPAAGAGPTPPAAGAGPTPPAAGGLVPPAAAGSSSVPPARAVGAVEALQEKLAASARELKLTQEQRNRLLTRLMQAERRIHGLQQELRQRDAQLAELQARLSDQPDDLTRIQGIGAGFEARLRQQGVERVEQIANWTLQDLERIAPRIKTTAGRIMRDGWVEQAKALLLQERS